MYRREALEHHLNRREEAVLPRMARPPVARLLWLGVLLLGCAGGLFATARLPEYASGTAVVVPVRPGSDRLVLTALLPAEALPRLRAGQPALVRAEGGAAPQPWRVAAVEPRPLGPDAVRARFGPTAAAQLRAPAAVVRLRFAPARGEPATLYAGSVLGVDVQVGWRRITSFLTTHGRA